MTFLRTLFAALLLYLVAGGGLSAFSQQTAPPLPTGPATVNGLIVDATSGVPIAGAAVTLVPVNNTGRALIPSPATTTADGTFSFQNVPPGQFAIRASATEYVDGSWGQRRPLETEFTTTVTAGTTRRYNLTLWKAVEISGTIRDASDKPVANVGVLILRKTFSSGQFRYALATRARTDAVGRYVATKIAPGEYAVVVPSATATYTPSLLQASATATSPAVAVVGNALAGLPTVLRPNVPVGKLAIANENPGAGAPVVIDEATVTVTTPAFFRKGATLTDASVVTAEPGAHLSTIDVTLRRVTGRRVSGVVTRPPGFPDRAGLMLIEPGAGGLPGLLAIARTALEPDGSFTFLGVPPGRYLIRLSTAALPSPAPAAAPPSPMDGVPTFWANGEVTVGDTNVSGITLAAKPALNVSGQFRFAGSGAQPTPEVLSRLVMSWFPIDSANLAGRGSVDADGRLTMRGLVPGRYAVSWPALGTWSFKSLRIDGRDLTGQPLEMTDRDLTNVVVEFSDQLPEVRAVVRIPATPDVDCDLLLFPADYRRWIANGADRYLSRRQLILGNGVIRMTALPPGEYILAAVEGSSASEWPAPDALDAVARVGTRIVVPETGAVTQPVFIRRILPAGFTRPPAPPGYTWEDAPDVGSAFLRPDAWFFKKEAGADGPAYFVTKERIPDNAPAGTVHFTTGWTINVLQVTARTGQTPSNFAANAIAEMVKNTQTLAVEKVDAPRIGAIAEYGVLVRQTQGANATRMRAIFRANDATGTLWFAVFEAPLPVWDKEWPVAETVIKHLIVNPDR